MCGRFTAMFSWSRLVDLYEGPTRAAAAGGEEDREITFRVMANIPVIVYDREAGKRRVIAARWGFPLKGNWKVPQPIHARKESLGDPKKSFMRLMHEGKRGIVMMKTFCEAPDVPGPTQQHIITPGERRAIGVAYLWDDFSIPEPPGTLRACVMVTVPANALISKLPTDRMPAVLDDSDWATWLGEPDAPNDPEGVLRTVEGVHWQMSPEERKATTKRRKPTVSDPGGLF